MKIVRYIDDIISINSEGLARHLPRGALPWTEALERSSRRHGTIARHTSAPFEPLGPRRIMPL